MKPQPYITNISLSRSHMRYDLLAWPHDVILNTYATGYKQPVLLATNYFTRGATWGYNLRRGTWGQQTELALHSKARSKTGKAITWRVAIAWEEYDLLTLQIVARVPGPDTSMLEHKINFFLSGQDPTTMPAIQTLYQWIKDNHPCQN